MKFVALPIPEIKLWVWLRTYEIFTTNDDYTSDKW